MYPRILRSLPLALALGSIAALSPARAQMFAPPVVYPAYLPPPPANALVPDGAVAADFNGDGHQDLAVINRTIGPDPTLVIYLNNAFGMLNASSEYSLFDNPGGIVAADINGDGKVDLAVSNWGWSPSYSGVTVLLGSGTGGFFTFLSTADLVVNSTHHLVLRDLNGDGKLDLLVGVHDGTILAGSSWEFVVMLGLAGGLFSAPEEFDSTELEGTTGNSWTLMDVDGDGKVDIVLAAGCDHAVCGIGVTAMHGNGDGTFGDPEVLLYEAELENAGVTDLYLHAATSADVDGDGKLDFIFAGERSVYWCRAPGNDDLAPPQLIGTFPVFPELAYIRAIDFDKNGRIDVAVGGSVFLHQPNGSWLAQWAGGASVDFFAARDLDHDLLVDLVASGPDQSHIAVYKNLDPLLMDGFEGGNFSKWLGGKKP